VLLVVGPRDAEFGTVSLRDRLKATSGALPIATAIDRLQEEILDRRVRKALSGSANLEAKAAANDVTSVVEFPIKNEDNSLRLAFKALTEDPGMTKRKSGNYKFRKHDSIGANDAENDEQFLPFCFEDTGDLSTLSALDHPARIVLGRTGSGKSALLLELKRKHRKVIEIDPESLSLNFICNSTIIRFLSELGINLDPFYKLLWRHVLAITLLQARFEFTDEASTRASFLSILGLFESSAARQSRQAETERRKKAVAYLEKWGGGSFWKDVDVRTKEITSRFETEVTTRLANSIKAEGASITPFKAIVAGQRQAEESDLSKLSIEQRAEVKHYAQDVVNEIQVKELTGMLPFLDEVLTGAPTNYYVTIDRLDEKWVDDKLRYRLLKALVDTVREFGKVHRAKIIIALRIDLVESIFHETKTESGFQEEKYRSLYLPLKWSRSQLIDLLDKRVAKLIRDQFTTYVPRCEDILPKHLGDTNNSIDYILDRTWMRPRDAIYFLNACISRAEGRATFSKEIVTDAEGEYSLARKRSLISEWYGLYPCLEPLIDKALNHRPQHFQLRELADSVIDELCLQIVCASEVLRHDQIYLVSDQRVRGTLSHAAARAGLAFIMFRTGAIGIKPDAASPARWADNESYSLSSSEVTDDCRISIHPALWRALGVAQRPSP